MILLAFVEFGAVLLWLIAPTIMFFEEKVPNSKLSPVFYKMNKNNVPMNAMILQGVVITIIMLGTTYLPSVNSIYNILLFMATIVYFIPFLFIAIAYIKASKNNHFHKPLLSRRMAIIVGYTCFVSVLFGIIISFMPPSDLSSLHQIIIYELELIGGPLLIIISAIFLYKKPSTTK